VSCSVFAEMVFFVGHKPQITPSIGPRTKSLKDLKAATRLQHTPGRQAV